MVNDPGKPLIRLEPGRPQRRLTRDNPPRPQSPEKFTRKAQGQRLGPRFQRLADVLARDPAGLELRQDPTALAPERLLVFEVRGSIQDFARAIAKVPGLELVDEEELPADEDKQPVAYLLVPDAKALTQILRLWTIWLDTGELPTGFSPWRNVFDCLREIRPWGPSDRVQDVDRDILNEQIAGRADDDQIFLEIELVFRANNAAGAATDRELAAAVRARGGNVVSRARLDDIAYHALLVRLPVRAIRAILERAQSSIAGLDPVMHIRPQSVATALEVEDVQPISTVAQGGIDPSPDAILALLDGVPVAGHPLLRRHLIVEDHFGLEAGTLVNQRVHGTAMASLIIHGDRNLPEAMLPRRIHCIPVLGASDEFPQDRLIVDVIYQAVLQMRESAEPTARHVIIVNLSLGNRHRQFQGQISPWARLLDRLAYRYGILFLVSAGNIGRDFEIPGYATSLELEAAAPQARSSMLIQAIANIQADRRLLSPAETVNGLTIGAKNADQVSAADRAFARSNIDPYPNLDTSNPSSALGPGYAGSVKPDLLMPGAREHLRVTSSGGGAPIRVAPGGPSRGAGLKVAAPPSAQGLEGAESFTNGTSAATSMASRTAHRIHDALEAGYGEAFLNLPPQNRATLIKALLVHPARWPDATASFVRRVLGPQGRGQAPKQKDNVRRFVGYGPVDPDEAVACAADRATFWATGQIGREQRLPILVPIPAAYGGQARLHSISATLAWFTPVLAARRSYRTVRMKIIDPDEAAQLGVTAHGDQPDLNQTNRGTVYTRSWRGEKAALVPIGMNMPLWIQREPDQGQQLDEAVTFGLAITIAMPGVNEIYDQVRDRLRDPQRSRAT